MINLKHFKKIKSDEKSTTMQHPSGHTITIAHEALSEGHRKYLSKIPMHEGSANKGKLKVQKMAEGGEVKSPSDIMDEGLKKFESRNNPPEQQTFNMTAPWNDIPALRQQAPQVQQPQAQQPQDTGMDQYGFGAEAGMLQQAQQLYGQGVMGQAEAQAAQAKAQAGAAANWERQQQNLMNDHNDVMQQFHDMRTQMQEAAKNNTINPNHYMESMSSGQKVMNAIGLILGGLGSGLTGGPNMAADYLNKQIERDIDSQKANINNRDTLFSKNMQLLKDHDDAINMTRMQLHDIYNAKLMQAAQASGSQQAMSIAQQHIAENEMKLAPQIAPLLMKQTIAKSLERGNMGPEHTINAYQQIGRLSPQEATQANKELADARSAQNITSLAMDNFKQVNEMFGRGIMRPGQRDALIEPIVAAMSKDTAGRYTEQDAEAIKALFPKLGDTDETARTKMSQIQRILTQKSNYPVLDSLNLNPMGGNKQVNFKPSR